MIEMLIGLMMTADERTCLLEAQHPLVIEAQDLAAANDMAGVVIIAWGSSEGSSSECYPKSGLAAVVTLASWSAQA